LARATITIVAEPRGLSVAQVTHLRRRMRGVSAEYKVAKNTLAVRALDGGEHAPLRPMLVGQTALIFGYGDPVIVAKEVRSYTKENEERIAIKGGVLEGQLFPGDAVARLADLGTKEQLRAQLLGVLSAPATKLVRLLNEPARSLARVLAARAESGAGTSAAEEA
jgi:large subunit ribosomal protein L10